jgi:5-methyltetrahydropteroyltriglutamate--homocysteine methyltransferase
LSSANKPTLTVIGNYPKTPDRPYPARLRNALAGLDRGTTSHADLARVQDDVTREVIDIQAAAGVDLVTDGQVRWLDELTYVAGTLGGVALGKMIRWFDTNTYFREPVVESEITWRSPITARDYAFARDATSLPVKAVLPGPYTLARLSRDEAYGNFEALALAYAEALNQEARELQALGAPVIQFNEPAITQHPQDLGAAEVAWRRVLRGLTTETAVHLYFGPSEAAMPVAIDAGFTTVGIDATIPGAIEALGEGPLPVKLCLGAVDARITRMESREQIVTLLHKALRLLPPDRLYASPNMGLEFLPREQAWMKLRLLTDAVAQLGARD